MCIMSHTLSLFQASSGIGHAESQSMIVKCAWCYPHGRKFMAQHVMKHGVSHTVCPWHVRLIEAQVKYLDSQRQKRGHGAPAWSRADEDFLY